VTEGPLIVQSDKTLLLEVDHPQALECRMAIAPFAELERSPEHVHTYRLTPLGLWNARAAGHDAEQVVDALVRFSRYAVPHALLIDVADTMDRYGRLQLVNDPAHGLILRALDRAVLEEIVRQKKIMPMLGARIDDDSVLVHTSERGRLKQALLKVGWPAEDLAGYVDGEAHPIELDLHDWSMRAYQQQAVDGFWAGGSGVVVLPCGAGKTLVGAAAMAQAKATTLILVTNTVAGRQWKRELLARTSLTEEEIGEYSGERKEIRPVTIATYQIMTTRRKGEYLHLELFGARDWGLIVYDEVHLLPAPIFRLTADLQSRRRLGLTATLIREDGHEGDVFSLIGPKRYDAPWRDIESQGWIAPADCTEVRVTLTDAERMAYATAEPEDRYRVCATARTKLQGRTLISPCSGEGRASRGTMERSRQPHVLRPVAHRHQACAGMAECRRGSGFHGRPGASLSRWVWSARAVSSSPPRPQWRIRSVTSRSTRTSGCGWNLRPSRSRSWLTSLRCPPCAPFPASMRLPVGTRCRPRTSAPTGIACARRSATRSVCASVARRWSWRSSLAR